MISAPEPLHAGHILTPFCCGIDSMARGSLNCHCEEAKGRRGALSAKREEVPLGCNLGKAVTISPEVPCHPTMSCEIATSAVGLLAMTRQGGTAVHQSTCAVE